MEHLKNFLEKFKKFGLDQKQISEATTETLGSFFGQNISSQCRVVVKPKIVKIIAPNIIRTEIILNKIEILESINSKLSENKKLIDIVF